MSLSTRESFSPSNHDTKKRIEAYPRRSPLIVAAADGNTTRIKEELDAGIYVDSRDLQHGRTLLMWAARGGHEDAVQLLLECHANSNSLDFRHQTPLLHAAGNGHNIVVRKLLAAGAHPDHRDSSGHTSLMLAAKTGSLPVVRSLLIAGVNPDVQEWRSNRTALSFAAERGHGPLVEALLDGDAAVDLADNNDRTPLSWAAMNGHVNAVDILLHFNANTRTKDLEFGRTPFLWAIKHEQESVIQILKELSPPEIDYGLAQRPLPKPSTRLDKLQREFITIKPDFNWRKTQGGDLLVWAIDSDREEDAMTMIQQGANISWQDDDGSTVLHHAASKGLLKVITLLLGKDIDLSPVDNLGGTPLYSAVEGGHAEVVRLLIKRNIDLDGPAEGEWTPLICAASEGHEQIVSLLLDAGADPMSEDENGRNALSYAAENGHRSLVLLLLEKGLSPDEGLETSALIGAVSRDDRGLAELLLEKGADPYSDEYSICEAPPLVLAASHGDEPMMELLLGKDNQSNDIKKDHIWMALVEASKEGKDGAVRLLLEQRPFEGIEEDKLDDRPLLFAHLWGHEKVIALLEPYYNHLTYIGRQES